MAIDSMYLENLDEYINDENKIVTYKWLSTTLQVHVNMAKQMLYSFVQHQRNDCDNESLSVVYFVAGLSEPTEDSQIHKCAVVREEDLSSCKSTFAVVTSCHIYSVQKVKLKDSSPLYLADYNELKARIFKTNKYGAIQCVDAHLRSESEMDAIRSLNTPSEVPSTTKPLLSNGSATTNEHKPAPKPQQKKGIAGMFATAAKKKDSTEKKNTVVVTDEKKETKPSKNAAGKKGGVMAFFSKQPEKKTESTVSSKKSPVIEKTETSKELSLSPSPIKRKTAGKSKKVTRDSDSEEESIGNKKKRRRIRDTMFESSSEEEIEIIEESPIPSPDKAPSPAPDLESPVAKHGKKKASPTREDGQDERTTGERRRKRRRKLVPKTFQDEDGFIVTEKVWESESTDASEVEEPPKPPPKVPTPTKSKTPPAKSKKKASPSKGSKQMSMMSFFKKK